jgi:hypothetical protein
MLSSRCGWDMHTLLQYDADGNVLFQHRCRDKFRLVSSPFAGTPQYFAENQYNPRLRHEDLCFQILAELQAKLTPSRSA